MNISYLKYCLGFFLVYMIFPQAFGQNISFDSTFGVNARTFTQNGNPSVFSSVYKFTTVKPDGSFFMAGEYSQPDTNYFVTKFKANGSIDSSFATNGKLYIRNADFGVSVILSAGIDSSFRFFFVGKTTSPNGSSFFRLKVIRYTVAAKIDSTFGVNGIADIPFDNLQLAGINFPVAAYRDGRLLISCLLYEGISESCGLVRLKQNGKLDSSFATNGKLYLPPSSGLTTFYTLDIQPDEKILFTRQFNSLLRLFRYNTNGTIDNNFNQTGIINIDFPATYNSIQAIRIWSNNKILLAAGSIAGYYLYRFKPNGLRDSTFGGIGYVPYTYGFKTYARDFAEQPDGKILAAGVIQDNQQPIPNINSLITRTNENGSIDSMFDDDGVWFFSYGGNPSSGMKNISLLQSGKLLFSGLESGSDWVHFVTYRLKEVYKIAATPVTWGTASATPVNYNCSSQVDLKWSTLYEVNTSYFKIQHSVNNVQLTTLAQVPAAGNSTGAMTYGYVHTSPSIGDNFYEISVVTTGGQEFSYGTIHATVTASSAPIFQWQAHEIIKKTNEDCLPAIRLHFNTLRAIASDSIIIEHSTDSLAFKQIGGVGVSNPQIQITHYEFTHQNPIFGKNYYRLKIRDQIAFCYSAVYVAELKDINSLIIYPVPTDGKLLFNQLLPPGTQILIYDMKGALVRKSNFSTATNELRLFHLASGQYVMKIIPYCKTKVFKFIKISQ